MKKLVQLGYIVIFFAICIIPTVFYFVGGTNNEDAENRSTAEKPVLVEDGSVNLEYPVQMEAYFAENFGFRTDMVNALANFYYNVLEESYTPKVVVGQEGWLFSSETLDDYYARNTLNEQSVDQFVKTLELMDEYVASKGAELYFTIAPNKNSIYPELMPERYIQSDDPNNYALIADELEDSDVNFIDLKSYFLSIKDESEQLYHKFDTHWNNYGALHGYNYMMSEMGLNTTTPNAAPYKVEETWEGDLYRMFFPEGEEKDEQYVYDIPENYYSQRPFQPMDMNITTNLNEGVESVNGDTALMVYRDSFFSAIIPFCSNDFSEVSYSRQVPYNLDDVDQDIVLIEIVERNVEVILDQAPLMMAPERTDINEEEYVQLSGEALVYETTDETDYVHIYGYYEPIDAENTDAEEVIVKINGKYYEAFPILETKIEEKAVAEYGTDAQNTGFSLRVDKSLAGNLDNIEVYVKK